MNDSLDGISTGTSSTSEEQKENSLDEIAEYITLVDDGEELKELIESEEKLEGVTKGADGGDVSPSSVNQARSVASQTRAREEMERQLEELEQISSNTELFKRMASLIAEQNQELTNLTSEIKNIEASNRRGPVLIVKDAGVISFDKEDQGRSIVDKEDITTSQVLIKTPADNSGSVWVGNSGVNVDDGYKIEPGTREIVPVDVLESEFQIAAESEDDKYTYMALGVLGGV